MKYITGDLVQDNDQFDLITHGCNCFCNMGSGIAPQIKKKYPEAYDRDLETKKGDRAKLGTVSYTRYTTPIVVNSYTQFSFSKHAVNIDYDAVRSCMKEIKRLFHGKKMGLPKIGAGLARGDWNILEKIIEEELEGEDVTIVLWKKNATLEEADELLGDKTDD